MAARLLLQTVVSLLVSSFVCLSGTRAVAVSLKLSDSLEILKKYFL